MDRHLQCKAIRRFRPTLQLLVFGARNTKDNLIFVNFSQFEKLFLSDATCQMYVELPHISSKDKRLKITTRQKSDGELLHALQKDPK